MSAELSQQRLYDSCALLGIVGLWRCVDVGADFSENMYEVEVYATSEAARGIKLPPKAGLFDKYRFKIENLR